MASHHHPQHHCHHLNSHPTTTCCCCSCSCTPSHFPPPPDPLLQSIATHLLHPAPPQPHFYPAYVNPAYNPHPQYYPPQTHKQNQQFRRHNHHQEDEQQSQPIVSSLLRRIAALESSLRHHSSAPYSLRDAAARAIQIHFRAFLVRRSRTLRQLKDLAFIKSTLNTLKTSLSDNAHFDSRVLHHKAMGLLVKLDSIQGGDPMIRDGKRSITMELIRFMDFVDGVSVKRHELSSRALKNLRFSGSGTKSKVSHRDDRMRNADCEGLGGDERKLTEKLREQVEKIRGLSRVSVEDDEEEDVELGKHSISINGKYGVPHSRIGSLVKRHGGVQAKEKKNVSFAENGKVYRIIRNSHGPVFSGDCNGIDGSDSIDPERELLDNLCREVEEIGVSSKDTEADEEAHTEDEGSPQISEDERDPRRNLRTEGIYEMMMHDQGEDGTFVFSAPLPVKMESRADLMNKKKTVKVIK